MALEREIETYCREIERLLAEGEAGRHVLIKGDEIISIWDTRSDALQVAYDKYGLDATFAIKMVDPKDPERIRRFDAQKASNPCQV